MGEGEADEVDDLGDAGFDEGEEGGDDEPHVAENQDDAHGAREGERWDYFEVVDDVAEEDVEGEKAGGEKVIREIYVRRIPIRAMPRRSRYYI